MAKTVPKKRMRRLLRFVLLTVFLAVFIFSGCNLYGIWQDNQTAKAEQEELLPYKPQTETLEVTIPPTEKTVNTSILQLQEKYPDVCGWVTIDNTNIDYCFARAENNDKYLRHALDGDYLVSGTVFLDYRCERDLTGMNSILYGHKMKNGTMFGDLSKFTDKDFFDANSAGTLYLPYETCQLEIMAYMVVSSTDSVVYDPYVSQSDFLSYIQAHARRYRELELTDTDVFLTLSTCNYEYDGARSVLIAKIVR